MLLLKDKIDNVIKTDEDVLAASVGQPSAFGILIDRYQREFIRKIRQIVRNKDEAEDIVQDTFIKIYRNSRKFEIRDGASFGSWAYKILLNTCYSHLKKRKRERELLNFADDEMFSLVESDPLERERFLDADELTSWIKKIPSALGRMLSLYVFEGKSYEDIAALEGVTVGTVRVRIHRARKELRKVVP